MPSLLDVLSGIGSALDTYSGAGSVRDLIAGENPWDQFVDPFNEEKRVSGRQMLESRGLVGENTDQGWIPDLGDLGGFAAEMLLDPTNLIGGAGLAKRLMGISKAKAANRGIEAANALSRKQRAMGFMPEEVAKLTKIVDETGQPKKMYHGTPHVFDKPDPSKWDADALYGPGHYTTDSGEIASTYAGNGLEASVRPIGDPLETSNELWNRMESAFKDGRISKNIYDYLSIKNAAPPKHGNWGDVAFINEDSGIPVHDLFTRNPANVKMNYIDARRPFNVDSDVVPPEMLQQSVTHKLKEIDKEIEDATKQYEAIQSGRVVEYSPDTHRRIANMGLDDAERYARSAVDFKQKKRHVYDQMREAVEPMVPQEFINAFGSKAIRDAGYDSIRHTGGAITGGAPHNVVIALDPKNVYLPYIAKELQDLQRVASPNSLLASLAGYNALAHSDLETDE